MLHADAQSRDPGARFAASGSADAILALVNAGASVEAADKDGLTGKHKQLKKNLFLNFSKA